MQKCDKAYDFTGGDDGIRGISVPDMISSLTEFYYFALIVVVVCRLVLRMIGKSPFGRALQAIRENSERTEFI